MPACTLEISQIKLQQSSVVSTQMPPASRQRNINKRIESAMQDCRTDCGCSRECLGYPRQTPCAWPVHDTVISTGPASQPFCPPGRATGWTGWLAGRASGVLLRGSWVGSGSHQWLLGGSLAPCLPVPGFGSGPMLWVPEQGRSISPVLVLTEWVLILVVVAEDSGGRRETQEERGGGRKEQERRELASVPAPCSCCAALCLCCAVPANVD